MKIVVLAALAGLAVTAPAQAAHYLGSYTSSAGAPSAATLSVTTANTLNAFGGYDVLALHGNVDGVAIAGMSGIASTPSSTYSADGRFIYDNMLFPASTGVDYWGLLFTTVNGTEYNLFSDSATVFELYSAVGGNFSDHSVGSFSLGQHINLGSGSGSNLSSEPSVPEPSSWAMMLVGFGALGAVMRKRRTSLTFG